MSLSWVSLMRLGRAGAGPPTTTRRGWLNTQQPRDYQEGVQALVPPEIPTQSPCGSGPPLAWPATVERRYNRPARLTAHRADLLRLFDCFGPCPDGSVGE